MSEEKGTALEAKWSRHFQCRAARLAPQGRGVTRKFPPEFPPEYPPGFSSGLSPGFPQRFSQRFSHMTFPAAFPADVPESFPRRIPRRVVVVPFSRILRVERVVGSGRRNAFVGKQRSFSMAGIKRIVGMAKR